MNRMFFFILKSDLIKIQNSLVFYFRVWNVSLTVWGEQVSVWVIVWANGEWVTVWVIESLGYTYGHSYNNTTNYTPSQSLLQFIHTLILSITRTIHRTQTYLLIYWRHSWGHGRRNVGISGSRAHIPFFNIKHYIQRMSVSLQYCVQEDFVHHSLVSMARSRTAVRCLVSRSKHAV